MTTRKLALFCITVLIQSASVRAGIVFEFNADGVLPSSQGATYFSAPSSGTTPPPETSIYSVAGGLLRQDSRGFGRADYFVTGVYDSSLETVLEWRAKVFSSIDAASMRIESFTRWQFFTMNDNGISMGPPGFSPITVAMNTTDDFHTYRVVLPSGGATFDFYVDGLLRHSGAMNVRSPSNSVNFIEWGDFTGSNDTTGRVDWDYIRLTSAVPEPSTLLSAALGLFALAGYAGWKGRRRSTAG